MSSPGSSSSSSGSESSNEVQSKQKYPPEDSSSASHAGTSTDDDDSSEDEAHGESGDEEAPVLSHADKRRQKRKQDSSTRPNSQPGAAKVKNTAELAPSKVPKRQNSVWVGNLSFKTTPEALRTFFEGVGEITRIHMPMKLASSGPNGRGAVKENRGFAYVDFATSDAKLLAITLSEGHLDGRRLLIKDGGDFTGRPSTSAQATGDEQAGDVQSQVGLTKTAQKILRAQKQPAGPTLFFGNLGFETTAQSITDLLNAHRKKADDAHRAKPSGRAKDASEDKDTPAAAPEEKDGAKPAPTAAPTRGPQWIRKVRLGTFEDTGKCKGWAFVDFTTTEHATEALTNPKNFLLDGRKLVVEYASPEAVRRGGGPRGPKGPPRDRERERGPRPEREAGAAGGDGADRRRERVRPKRKHADDAEEGAGAHADASTEKPAKRTRVEKPARPSRAEMRDGGRGSTHKTRAKPGAALAMAKRETVSIVPSQGTKIVF